MAGRSGLVRVTRGRRPGVVELRCPTVDEGPRDVRERDSQDRGTSRAGAMSGELQRVELAEDGPGLTERDEAATAHSAPHGRRGLVRLGVGAVVVVAGLVVGQAVIDARERAAVAALREVPGVLAPVGDALSVAYELPQEVQWLEPAQDGHRLLLVANGDDEAPHLQAMDSDTGEVLWDVRVAEPTNQDGATGVSCGLGRIADERAVVACLDTDAITVWGDEGEEVRREATYARVVVHAQDDGALVGAFDVDTRVEEIAMLDGIVAAVSRERGGMLTAYDAVTGQVRWRVPAPDTATEAEAGYFRAWMSAVGGVLAVSSTTDETLFVTADGSALPVERARGWVSPKRGVLAISLPNDADGSRTLIVRDGVVGPEIRGEALIAGVDDGSLGDVVLTTAGGLSAWDAESGERRWSLDADEPVATYYSALVLRGSVYATGPSTSAAFDGRTGRVLWTRESAGEESYGGDMVTDGERLYVVGMIDVLGDEHSSVPVVDALSFGGEALGRVGLPQGIEWLSPAGGRLLGSHVTETGRGSVVVLR